MFTNSGKMHSVYLFRYFIHYPAWNKKWDEWVQEAQVLKINGENRNKQKSIFENAKEHSSGGKRKSMGESKLEISKE